MILVNQKELSALYMIDRYLKLTISTDAQNSIAVLHKSRPKRSCMTKLFDCPYCDAKQVPVRDDAEACSTKCRMRKKRIKDKEKTNAQEK